jgi:hypothetical protein
LLIVLKSLSMILRQKVHFSSFHGGSTFVYANTLLSSN